MRLFDTHCHFDFPPFSTDFPHQLALAKQAGVERFLIPSIGPINWDRVARLAQQNPEIYYALGIHPYFLNLDSTESLALLEKVLAEQGERCVAVGECGLDGVVECDYHLQERVFTHQIALAETINRPLILHCRKTHNRTLQLLKKARFKQGGVLHGFSGSYQQAMQFIELGFYIGIGGVITYPRANKTRQSVTRIPSEYLLLETDSPDMPLYGHQGKDNHPKMLAQILSCLASLMELPEQTVAEIVWKNSNNAYGICE